MSEQKFNVLRGQFQDLKSLEIINFQVTILDGYAVASFDKPNFAKKLVKSDNESGNNNVKYSSKINSAIEAYKGLDRNEITKIMIKKLNSLPGAKVKESKK